MAYKECQSCGKMVHPNTKKCKHCGANPDAVKPVKEEPVKEQPIRQLPFAHKTSKTMIQAFSLAGWLIFAFSITGFIMAFIEKGMPSTLKIFGPLLGIVGGIIIVISSQLSRAVNEIADHCNEMLSILKSKQTK